MWSLLLLLALGAPPGDLAAVGVVWGRQSGTSVAILRSGGRTRVAAVGESAFGGRVVAVDARTVTLEYEGTRVEVPIASVGPSRPAQPALASSHTPDDPNSRSMERRELERRLGEEVPRILAETTVVPVTDAGRVTGLAITRLPEGLLTDAGLRSGDILTRINDTPIDGLPTLMGLWPRLQTARELHAVVLRNGQPVSLTVSLR